MEWYKSAVFYHIYPLGMLGAPKLNDYGQPVHRLKELDKWIKHIKDIGCNAVYIGPLFESVGHGYETTDYKKLDSRLGDNDDLKRFVKNCHEAGIRVIFDGVFNHTGRDFFAFRDLLANRENSPYRDWYCNVNFYGNNEYNDGFSYDNWGGYNLLVKLNQRNPQVRDYICDVIRFWVQEFDVDGIRLDAADVLDFEFMRALRETADSVKPEFWLMGEVIHGDYSRWVNSNTLHSVTNYVLHKGLYSGHNDHNYFEIAHTVKRLADLFSNNWESVCLYNFTDNHDVERIYSKLINKAHFYPVHILEYTLPGVPSIYYGSEFGIEGRKERGSDDSLRPALKYEDYENSLTENPYTAFIAALGKARLSVRSLSQGDYREITLTNRQYMFTRNTDRFTCIIAVNNDDNDCSIQGHGVRDGLYRGILSGNEITINGGYVEVQIPADYGEIWVSVQELEESNYRFEPVKAAELKKVPTKAEAVEQHAAESIGQAEENIGINNDEMKTLKSAEETAVKNTEIKKSEQDEKIQKADESQAAAENNAAEKYGLGEKYSSLIPDRIRTRSDYDNMTMEELQVGILEKMAANGPVNSQMIKTVMDNVYMDSLKNWIRSFR